MSSFDVIGLGTVVIDHLVVLQERPPADSKIPVLEDRFQVGGPVPTALALLARLGHCVGYAGAWGADPFGAMVSADLEREGIADLGPGARPDARTGFAHVWVERAEATRTVAYQRPTAPPTPAEAERMPFAGARALHLDGWPPDAALAAAKRARAAGARVVLDAGSPKDGTGELLEHVDCVNAPRRFLTAFFGDDDPRRGLRALRAHGPRIVTVTDGAAGAYMDAGGERYFAAPPPVAAHDTTGAGDVFTGALIHGLLAALSPDRLLGFAVAAAARKCAELGNRDALPDRAAIEASTRLAERV